MTTHQPESLWKNKKFLYFWLIIGLMVSMVKYCQYVDSEKEWKSFLTAKINHIHNPYMINKFIYKYTAIDMFSYINDLAPYKKCTFNVYTLNKNRIEQFKPDLNYLNQLNDKSLLELNQDKYFKITERKIETIWINQSNLDKDFLKKIQFSQEFENYLKERKKNPYHYISKRYTECMDFFVKQRGNKQKFEGESLDFISKFRRRKYAKQYQHDDFVAVLTDKDTFIKISLGCAYNHMLFINFNKQIMIEMKQRFGYMCFSSLSSVYQT